MTSRASAKRLRALLRRFLIGRRGVAAVEMAMVSPVLLLVLGGAIDYGGALSVKFNLDNAVTAASSYALNNASKVGSANGATLAASLASIAASAHSSNWANATININNGPTATQTGGTGAASGTASNADSCYCPTGSKTAIVWGAAVTCGAACPSGALAGKFVVISASHNFAPMILPNRLIGSSFATTSVVQTQ